MRSPLDDGQILHPFLRVEDLGHGRLFPVPLIYVSNDGCSLRVCQPFYRHPYRDLGGLGFKIQGLGFREQEGPFGRKRAPNGSNPKP